MAANEPAPVWPPPKTTWTYEMVAEEAVVGLRKEYPDNYDLPIFHHPPLFVGLAAMLAELRAPMVSAAAA